MTMRGEFKEHLDISRDTNVQGAVTGGATIRAGAELHVDGVLGGPLVIEGEGYCSASGVVDVADVTNDGTLLVSGVVTGDLPKSGLVLVRADSLLTDSRRDVAVLRASGELEPVVGHVEKLTLNLGPYMRYLSDGTFEVFERAS